MPRLNQFGINDPEAWRDHVRMQRREATKRYRERNQVKQIICSPEFYEFIKRDGSDGMGWTIKERQAYLLSLVPQK